MRLLLCKIKFGLYAWHEFSNSTSFKVDSTLSDKSTSKRKHGIQWAPKMLEPRCSGLN